MWYVELCLAIIIYIIVSAESKKTQNLKVFEEEPPSKFLNQKKQLSQMFVSIFRETFYFGRTKHNKHNYLKKLLLIHCKRINF